MHPYHTSTQTFTHTHRLRNVPGDFFFVDISDFDPDTSSIFKTTAAAAAAGAAVDTDATYSTLIYSFGKFGGFQQPRVITFYNLINMSCN